MDRVRVAIDIDSTLHHYWDVFGPAAQRRFGVDLRYENQVTWNIARLRAEQVRALVEETHREHNILAAEPYPGAVEAVRSWHEAGHFVHVTSHRAQSAHDATARWLERIGLPFDELYCSWDKVPRCVEIEIDVLVDDSPVNLRRAQAAGIVPSTLLHPWNVAFCEEEGIVSGRDWRELATRMEPVLATPARSSRVRP